MDNEIVLVFLIVGAIVVAASFVSISLRDKRKKKELEITRVRWQLADEWKARSERNRAAKELALATEVLRKLAVGVAPVKCQFPMNQDWLNSVGEPAGSHREEISFDEAVNRALNAAHGCVTRLPLTPFPGDRWGRKLSLTIGGKCLAILFSCTRTIIFIASLNQDTCFAESLGIS